MSGPRGTDDRGLRFAHLRKNCQRPALVVLKRSHPLFRAVRVSMDHMWRAQKFDASLYQIRMGHANIGYVEIDDRLCAAAVFRLGQEQANSVAIEKSEIAKGIEVPKTKHFAVPLLGFLNIQDGTRDLGNRSQV